MELPHVAKSVCLASSALANHASDSRRRVIGTDHATADAYRFSLSLRGGEKVSYQKSPTSGSMPTGTNTPTRPDSP